MPLKAGTVEAFDTDSMAAAMEEALIIEWNELRRRGLVRTGLPAGMEHYWRVFLVAVAQGVVRHLKEQAGDAFRIDVEARQVIGQGEESGTSRPAIESRNPDTIMMQYIGDTSGTGGAASFNLGIRPFSGLFRQTNEAGNLIWCEGGSTVGEGGGTVVEVRHEGALHGVEEPASVP